MEALQVGRLMFQRQSHSLEMTQNNDNNANDGNGGQRNSKGSKTN